MKLAREKLLSHARNGEERALLARALDRAETALHSGFPQVTGFYDPYHAGLIISTVAQVAGLAAAPLGGYPAAERKRVALYPAELQPSEEDYNFGFIAIGGSFKMTGATHRDFLGSLLGLGLKREKFGDILVDGEGARVVTAGDAVSYIRANLTKVGRVHVSVREITASDLQPPDLPYKETRATVPSLRLDAVAAAGFGTSRSKIVREIQAERFFVNWRPCPDPSAQVREGDILSARGRGRVEVVEVKGPLKSGRLSIQLKKYL